MEKKFTITFIREKKTVTVKENTTVMDALKQAGIFLDAPCGGQGTCGKCLVKIKDSTGVHTVKACRTKITENLEADTKNSAKVHQILTSSSARRVLFQPGFAISADTEHCCLAAFDIGTTTIASYLLDGRTGEELCTASCMNPQRAYGADVISRANYALENNEEVLTQCIRQAIRDLLAELAKKAGISLKEIYGICLVGNTCMHHLFFQLPLNSLVLAPYEPAQKGLISKPAAEFGFDLHPQARLLFLPVIAGFVGADTTGCLLAVRPDLQEEISLILDIGTNGELVLGNRERLVCCSTAAGPAFEGAKIQCGMRGAEGAVDHVKLLTGSAAKPGENLVQYSVIGGGSPVGICGSGLIDIVAVLRRLELIDETGRLLTASEGRTLLEEKGISKETAKALSSHLVPIQDMPGFVLDSKVPSVYLTQKDIREVQLAKGAISAGILLLERHLGITHEDIKRVYIAGAFGNYMNPDSACDMGLLPAALRKRILPVGNAAGEGAKLALINKEELAASQKLAQQAEFLELAAVPEFQDFFIDELEFPDCEKSPAEL